MQPLRNQQEPQCWGCMEIRVGVMIIAVLGGLYAIGFFYLFVDYLIDGSDIHLFTSVMALDVIPNLIGSICGVIGAYKRRRTLVLIYCIFCGFQTVYWFVSFLLTFLYLPIGICIVWLSFAYIARKYWIALKEKTEPPETAPIHPPTETATPAQETYLIPVPMDVTNYYQQPLNPAQPLPVPQRDYYNVLIPQDSKQPSAAYQQMDLYHYPNVHPDRNEQVEVVKGPTAYL